MSNHERKRSPLDFLAPAKQRLVREGFGFVVIGGAQLLLDWLCFVLLSAVGIPVVPANVAGRAAGAALGFWLNGAYTFADPDGSCKLGRTQLLKFFAGWGLVAALSTLFVWMLAHLHGLQLAWIGKPVVDGVLAVFGFLLSKYWIFR